MDPAHNYWPINPNDHHHLLSSSSLQPQAQFLQTHEDMNTTSISDQLKYCYSSLESSPPPTSASHYSYNHCYDSLSSPNYASLMNALPSSAVRDMGLAPSSDYNQGSSIQLIGHELETDSIPGCPRAPSPRPPEEQQKYYSNAHTQEYPSAQLVSLITPPICPDSFVDINYPAGLITYSSSDKYGIALEQKAAAAAAAATQHMIAERKRRQRQSESFKALLTVVPSIIKKDNKATILERTIQHIKQLQDRVDELQQHKHALLMQAATKPAMIDTTDVMGGKQFLSTPTHADNVLEEPLTSSQTSQSMPSPETNSDIVVTSQAGGHQPPLFHIKMNINVQPTEANGTIIKAISGLKDKKLHCIHVKSEYYAENSHLRAKILAKFKDGENSKPSADEIMEIKEWWRQLITFFTRGAEEP